MRATPGELVLPAGYRPAGVALAAAGERLRYRAKRGALTPDLRDALVLAKPLLLAALPFCGTGAWAEVFEEDRDENDAAGHDTLADVLAHVDDLDLHEHLRFMFDERAGIAEFDGGLSREDAEGLALAEVRAAMDAGCAPSP